MLKCAESEADTQQHLHKRSAEAVVVGQTSMGAHFLHFSQNFNYKLKRFLFLDLLFKYNLDLHLPFTDLID